MATRHMIERFCDHHEMGTFGRWLIDGVEQCVTVEQPWNDNIPFASCVPAGDYELVQYNSPSYGRTFALVNHDLDVGLYKGDAKRFACLIHIANIADEIEGCVAPGKRLGMLGNKWAVLNSGDAMELLLPLINDGDILSIVWKDHP